MRWNVESTGFIRVSAAAAAAKHWRRKWQPTPVFVPGESQGVNS